MLLVAGRVKHFNTKWQTICFIFYSTLCLKKNDSDVAYYNFDADQSKDVAERVCYQAAVCNPTSPN